MPAARQWRIKSAALAARLFLHQDVSFEESWPGVIDATERRFGRLDVMVVNAGIGILCGAIEMSLADWRRQTAVNLHGVFLSVKYAVPAMRRAGGGSIIIMSSRRRPRRLARGIRINTVHPGVIDTPIWTKLPVSAGANAPIDPNEVAKAGVPLGRAGQGQDIANGVLFLASDASNYMTGAELVIDGGMMAALGLGGAETYRPGVSSTVSAKCEFNGKFHMNISMGDSAKVALPASSIALMMQRRRPPLRSAKLDAAVPVHQSDFPAPRGPSRLSPPPRRTS